MALAVGDWGLTSKAGCIPEPARVSATDRLTAFRLGRSPPSGYAFSFNKNLFLFKKNKFIFFYSAALVFFLNVCRRVPGSFQPHSALTSSRLPSNLFRQHWIDYYFFKFDISHWILFKNEMLRLIKLNVSNWSRFMGAIDGAGLDPFNLDHYRTNDFYLISIFRLPLSKWVVVGGSTFWIMAPLPWGRV